MADEWQYDELLPGINELLLTEQDRPKSTEQWGDGMKIPRSSVTGNGKGPAEAKSTSFIVEQTV